MPREAPPATRAARRNLIAAVTFAGSATSCGVIPPLRRATFDVLWNARGTALLIAWTAFVATVVTLVGTRYACKTDVRTWLAGVAGALDVMTALSLIGLRLRPASLIAGCVISTSLTFTAVALSTATIAARTSVPIWRAAENAVADPAQAIGSFAAKKFNVSKITSTKVLRGVGCVLLVMVTVVSSAAIAGAIQLFGDVTGLHRSAAATPAAGTPVTVSPTTTTDPKPKVLHCVGHFGDAVAGVPQALGEVARTSGQLARDRYHACPLGPLAPRGDDLYEQPAYTNDSSRARVVAWIDDVGKPHATFVTSDQANGYRRIDPAIDWQNLGLPLPAIGCGGPAVQPFVDLDGELIAVGVESRVDEIGTWEEPIYIPGAILTEWLTRGQATGRVGVPAGRAKPHNAGLRQWFLNWSTPIDAPTTASSVLDLDQLTRLCG